ncbi:MAG: TylF/MycF/NovP-related O-methyltransferase [Halobacteriota archaeon]
MALAVHIGLWAGFTASKLAGDFVECGVDRGFMSSAIMEFLDWDSLNKTFYLLDTFAGVDPRYVSQEDEQCRIERERSAFKFEYVRGVESVKANFSQWKNTRIIEGSIPETLNQVETQNVAYLHLDMNCSPPEIAAINFFWDRLVPGAVVLLDDYAYYTYKSQKHAMDAFGKEKQMMIASLPTGQGLLMKPPE